MSGMTTRNQTLQAQIASLQAAVNALLARIGTQASEIKKLREDLELVEACTDAHVNEIYDLKVEVEDHGDKIDDIERRMPDHYHG